MTVLNSECLIWIDGVFALPGQQSMAFSQKPVVKSANG
jgi:hypothetical protein